MTNIDKLNRDIEQFPQVHAVTEEMHMTMDGVSRLVMLDRYSFKDTEKKTLAVGDLVILTVKSDPTFPARGIGYVTAISEQQVTVQVEEAYRGLTDNEEGIVIVNINAVDKPLELYYEQIAKRNAAGLAAVERSKPLQNEWKNKFYEQLASLKFVPAGRVLYGAGSGTNVTFFNCYAMPFIKDSRDGISAHRTKVMEIMSRGGGVGSNGSTLRPRNALARGVNGKSSGAVSWLDDIAKLTHLVQQGGSRRGAQMLMMSVDHPDVIEFIISKMQNPDILRYLAATSADEQIVKLANEKLKFTPLTKTERVMYENIMSLAASFSPDVVQVAEEKLRDGGTYSVHNPDFLTGANISVTITKDFMEAVKQDTDFALRFPDIDTYNEAEMAVYNEKWHEVGDVREWEALGHRVKTHRVIKAANLWDLINVCATYSAEPGIFFIDNANDKTNAIAYEQKVNVTNPCGEQPLAPFSVCNLAAINLSAFVKDGQVDFESLKETVRIGVRMQDNVIDATPYFLKENKHQALGERRIGMGVMGLADLLIKCEKVYGSTEGNKLVDEVFEVIAVTAYEASIELAKERGSFPFLHTLSNGKVNIQGRRRFVQSGFMQQMPQHIRDGVLEHGIRNSHLLTVAPTGSTGTLIGCGTGLEPYFAFSYFRSGRLGQNIEVKAKIVEDYLAAHPEHEGELPEWFISAMELTPEAHVAVQCTIQKWVDSSISKTVNAPKGYSVQQVKEVYELLYKGGAKGGTVYVDGSRDSQVLNLTKTDEVATEAAAPQEKVFSPETIVALEQTSAVGNDIGDTCSYCRTGKLHDAGGCVTCDACGMQISCGR